MAQQGSSQPLPSASTTENPVLAVGRKVKSVLSSHQQSSVRILRESPSAEESRSLPVSNDNREKPVKGNTFANRFTGIRALFSHENHHANDESSELEHEYDQDTVDLLDVMDPEVSTLMTLTNVQNSLFVPSLGKVVNRRPIYRLSERPGEARIVDKLKASLKSIARRRDEGDKIGDEPMLEGPNGPRPLARTNTATSLSNSPYAVLPDGETLEGWTHAEKEELNDMVRHMLHSRRAQFKRSMKGFLQYVRRPLGLFITVYATLITLFGAAWVLFLIGWISLGSRQDYVINIVDNVLVALFAIIGDGLAPFRAVDTYHMVYIAYYHRKTWKRRDKLGLPELPDRNDLPDEREPATTEVDLESLVARRMPRRLARRIAPRIPKGLARRIVAGGNNIDPSHEYSVLTEEEQAKLEYHERKFSKSHTFYKPHETETHFAFPLKVLVTVVLLLDLHSCLQISLGACTWGIPYKHRPFALTTVILCCSITCNIMGGVFISIGDKRTRKKDVIERMMRQELTSEAIEELETRWTKEAEERGEIDRSVRKRKEEQKEMEEKEEIKKSWKVVPSLPKILLGKGVDHRQPSLPQKARRSSASTASSSTSSVTRKPVAGSNATLPPLPEDIQQPKPALRRGGEPPKQGVGQKVMGFIRKADLDRS